MFFALSVTIYAKLLFEIEQLLNKTDDSPEKSEMSIKHFFQPYLVTSVSVKVVLEKTTLELSKLQTLYDDKSYTLHFSNVADVFNKLIPVKVQS
jgi:hypothetical protein